MTITAPVTFNSSVVSGGGNDTVFPPLNVRNLFDGSDDWVSTPVRLGVSDSFTWCARFKTSLPGTTQRIMGQYTPSTSGRTVISVTASKFRFFNGTAIDSTTTIVADTWYYVACTYNDSTGAMELYINGSSEATATNAVDIEQSDLALGAQSGGGGEFFTGRMQDVRVYDRVLTANEVAFIHSRGSSGDDPTNTNLLANWTFEEGSGTTINDVSGNGNHGTANNITEFLFWFAAYGNFDGTNDHVSVPFLFNPASTAFSLTAWINADVLGGAAVSTLVQQLDSGGTGRTLMGIDTSKYVYTFIGASATTGTSVLSVSTWYNIAITFASGSAKVYVNGALENTQSRTAETTSGGLYLGVNKTVGNPYNGALTRFRAYSKALTADEVTFIYTNGASGTDPTSSNLLCYLEFTDGSGTTVTDSSGNGKHGTAVNTTESIFWQ